MIFVVLPPDTGHSCLVIHSLPHKYSFKDILFSVYWLIKCSRQNM